MLAKITTKNQITIPKKIINQLPDVKYFDVELKEGMVLLKPLKVYDLNLDQIRSNRRRSERKRVYAKTGIRNRRNPLRNYQGNPRIR